MSHHTKRKTKGRRLEEEIMEWKKIIGFG